MVSDIEKQLKYSIGGLIYVSYAVTTNAGILLDHDEKDEVWLKESHEILEKYEKKLKRILDLLKCDEDYRSYR